MNRSEITEAVAKNVVGSPAKETDLIVVRRFIDQRLKQAIEDTGVKDVVYGRNTELDNNHAQKALNWLARSPQARIPTTRFELTQKAVKDAQEVLFPEKKK